MKVLKTFVSLVGTLTFKYSAVLYLYSTSMLSSTSQSWWLLLDVGEEYYLHLDICGLIIVPVWINMELRNILILIKSKIIFV